MRSESIIRQTLRCTARADSTGGSIQLLQLAIALREYQLPLHELRWRIETDAMTIVVELTIVGPRVLLERLAERLVAIPGVLHLSEPGPQ